MLDLNKPKNTPVSVFVDEEPWFTGNVGIHKKSVAIKIQKRIDSEEDEENQQSEDAEASDVASDQAEQANE